MGGHMEQQSPHATAGAESRPLIEQHTIEVIPLGERFGRPVSLFSIWFNASLGPLTVITGALGPQVFGLNFLWSVAALLLGNLAGGVLMALHSAQGPRLGVPQMVQSRGQFGIRGTILVVALVLVMYVGFFAATLVTGAQSLQGVWGGLPLTPSIVLVSAVGLALTIFGYRYIHVASAWGTYLFIPLTAAVFVGILVHGLPANFLHVGGFGWAGFLGATSVSVLWQIAYAPYVSDYSRYMPSTTAGLRGTFWWTYAGTVVSSVLMMLIGIVIALMIKPGGDIISALDPILGNTLGKVVLLGFFVVSATSNALNLYGAVLTGVTAIQTFAERWLPTPVLRALLATAIAALSTVLAAAFSGGGFLANYENFIAVLQYFFIPWTAINLIDFYVVCRGEYDVLSFFRSDGGHYGRYRWGAITVYLVGFLVEVPFMATALYTGPIANALGGTDLSWMVSLVVTVPLYLLVARRGQVSDSVGSRPSDEPVESVNTIQSS